MPNELRYYLDLVKTSIKTEDFKPSYLITATKLPTGATEIQINTTNIEEKIDYLLEAYDDDMALKTNNDIFIVQLMVV